MFDFLYRTMQCYDLRRDDGSVEFRALQRNILTGSNRILVWTPPGTPLEGDE